MFADAEVAADGGHCCVVVWWCGGVVMLVDDVAGIYICRCIQLPLLGWKDNYFIQDKLQHLIRYQHCIPYKKRCLMIYPLLSHLPRFGVSTFVPLASKGWPWMCPLSTTSKASAHNRSDSEILLLPCWVLNSAARCLENHKPRGHVIPWLIV